MALSQDHRDALTEYVGLGERALEPVFVGRESFFGRVRSASAAACRGVPGTTMCLYGPPGVGKTAFISALEERQHEDDSLPQVVRVVPGELREPRDVLRRVASAIFADDSEAEKVVRWFTGGLESLEVGVGPIKAKFSGPPPDISPNAFPWLAMDRLLRGREIPDKPVALAVDEAQQISNTPGAGVNRVLADLHGGPRGSARPPVFALLAGLTHTKSVIAPTISRFNSELEGPMMNLTGTEAGEYCDRTMMEVLGLESSDNSRRLMRDWVADLCGGWPHHLRGAMAAVGKEMLRSDDARLRELDMSLVVRDIERSRGSYYLARMEGGVGALRNETAVLLERMDGSNSPTDIAEVGDIAARIMGEQPTRFAGEGIQTAREWVDLLIAKGTLAYCHPSDEGVLTCPIPSLRRYIETRRYDVESLPPNFGHE